MPGVAGVHAVYLPIGHCRVQEARFDALDGHVHCPHAAANGRGVQCEASAPATSRSGCALKVAKQLDVRCRIDSRLGVARGRRALESSVRVSRVLARRTSRRDASLRHTPVVHAPANRRFERGEGALHASRRSVIRRRRVRTGMIGDPSLPPRRTPSFAFTGGALACGRSSVAVQAEDALLGAPQGVVTGVCRASSTAFVVVTSANSPCKLARCTSCTSCAAYVRPSGPTFAKVAVASPIKCT